MKLITVLKGDVYMEKKVRREIQFNDVEKFEKFYLMYNDLFQYINDRPLWDGKSCKESGFDGFEYGFTFHMSKENFDMLRKYGIVKKLRQHPYKNDWMKGYKKDIWVLC